MEHKVGKKLIEGMRRRMGSEKMTGDMRRAVRHMADSNHAHPHGAM